MKKAQNRSAKYIPICNSDHHGEILLPGRHACNCEATKHSLINNCLNCGRIVCEQEQSGPCFTCGHLVCLPKQQEQISRMTKAGVILYNKLMNESNENLGKAADSKHNSLQDALCRRDKLLEYDQTVEMRTKVIDDQNDYFQTESSWSSPKEQMLLKQKKEEMYELMHGRKKQTRVTLDLSEKKVIEEKPVINFNVEELLRPDTSIFECKDKNEINIPKDFEPVYEEAKVESEKTGLSGIADFVDKLKLVRIQDSELQEMSDEGMCLSVHQPYASLLTAGIKKHEGRVWYTSYRGRLWIHAAGKQPSLKEINDLQQFYKHIGGNVKFPKTYPSGCLLGCVDLVECLPQEEYKAQYPGGEIASPYVFICEDAHELNFKFPMQGKHKLFKLDRHIHQAAKKTLRKLI